MVVPSGIVLPGSEPLPLHEVTGGLYVVTNAYESDVGYFAHSLLYGKERPATPDRKEQPAVLPAAPAATDAESGEIGY